MPPSTDMVESTFHFLRLARKITDVDAGFYVRGSTHFVDEKLIFLASLRKWKVDSTISVEGGI
jgi:hypothetical protein